MKLRIDVTRADGNTINGIFDSQADAEQWIADHKAEWGDDYQAVATDMTAEDDQAKKVLSRSEVRLACLDIIDQIAAVNQDGGATDDQMDSFYTNPQTVEIILALLAGSPKAASRVIAKVGPSFYPQAVVDQFVTQLQALI